MLILSAFFLVGTKELITFGLGVGARWLTTLCQEPNNRKFKINTLYVMKSQGRIPYRKVGHLLRFDFDEIVEWTKDNEK